MPTQPPPNDVVITVSTSPFTATGNSEVEKVTIQSKDLYDMFLIQIQQTTLGCLKP